MDHAFRGTIQHPNRFLNHHKWLTSVDHLSPWLTMRSGWYKYDYEPYLYARPRPCVECGILIKNPPLGKDEDTGPERKKSFPDYRFHCKRNCGAVAHASCIVDFEAIRDCRLSPGHNLVKWENKTGDWFEVASEFACFMCNVTSDLRYCGGCKLVLCKYHEDEDEFQECLEKPGTGFITLQREQVARLKEDARLQSVTPSAGNGASSPVATSTMSLTTTRPGAPGPSSGGPGSGQPAMYRVLRQLQAEFKLRRVASIAGTQKKTGPPAPSPPTPPLKATVTNKSKKSAINPKKAAINPQKAATKPPPKVLKPPPNAANERSEETTPPPDVETRSDSNQSPNAGGGGGGTPDGETGYFSVFAFGAFAIAFCGALWKFVLQSPTRAWWQLS